MTYHKYDRVKVTVDGEVKTLTITKLLLATNSYEAVTGGGKKLVVTHELIEGLA